MNDPKDDRFINDIMEIVDAYLRDDGDANLLSHYFASVAAQVHVQVIEMELEKGEHTLH